MFPELCCVHLSLLVSTLYIQGTPGFVLAVLGMFVKKEKSIYTT